MRYLLIIFSCIFFFDSSFGQIKWVKISSEEAEKKLNIVFDFYKNLKSFELVINYSSYKDHSSYTPHEKSSGYLKVNSTCIEAMQLGIKTIQNNLHQIIIDSSQKVILINNPDKNLISINSNQNFIRDINKAIEILYFSSSEKDFYKFIYSKDSPFHQVEFTVDKPGFISEYIIYYSLTHYDENNQETSIAPKISISNQLKLNSSVNISCNISKYLKTINNTLILTDNFKDFQLIDNRYYK